MKKILFIILIAIFGIAAASYITGPKTDNTTDTPQVAATIFPIYDIAQTIAGDDIDVTLILPPGTSPHTFDPTPKQLKALQPVDAVYTIGHGLDEFVLDIVPTNARVVTVDTNIALHEFPEDDHDDHHDEEEEHGHADEDHHEDEDHHDDEHGDEHEEDMDDHHDHAHGGTDPHYWLHPENAKTIAETITADLVARYPEHQRALEERQVAFIAALDQEIVTWKNDLASVQGKSFATLHDAFYYFADFADVNLAATFEPSPGKEPTPRYLAELSHEIEEQQIIALFNEPQLSFSGIESFASDNNIAVGTLDPLGGVEGRLSYIELMTYNIGELIAALR